MKNKSLSSKLIGKYLFLPILFTAFLFIASCEKNENQAVSSSNNSVTSTQQSERLRASVAEQLTAFATRNSPNRTSDFSDPAYNYTTYSTSSGNVYKWSDPTTGTSFTLNESTGGGGGLGQLAYDGKSFDYNYVFTIKASSTDPVWSGFLNGRDLLGVIAIDTDGDISSGNFILKNFAIFLVATNGGAGKYEFNDFSSTNVTNTFAIGEIIDLSGVPNASLGNFTNGGKVYFTSDGHVIVSSTDITMDNDAKIEDVTTLVEYSIAGSIMHD